MMSKVRCQFGSHSLGEVCCESDASTEEYLPLEGNSVITRSIDCFIVAVFLGGGGGDDGRSRDAYWEFLR